MAVKNDAFDTISNTQRRCPIFVRWAATFPTVRAATNALQSGYELLARKAWARFSSCCYRLQ
jgi:hypothetical protein